MKIIKKTLIILTIVFVSIIFTGCWNYREINEMGIVAGVAIDKDLENNKYILTTEIIETYSSGEKNALGSKIYVTNGETIFNAVRNIITKKSKRGYWGQAKVIIVSKYIAKNEMIPIIDFFLRDAEVHGDMKLIISNESTAGEILNYKGKSENEVTSYNIENSIKNHKSLSKYPFVNLWEFIQTTSTGYTSSIVPSIENSIENDQYSFKINGSYAFNKEKAVAWLNPDETKSVLYVKNDIDAGILEVKCNHQNSEFKIDIEIFRGKTKIKADTKDNKIYLKISSKIEGSIEKISKPNFVLDEKIKDKIKNQAEQTIEKSIKRVIYKAQNKFHSDIFGFSEIIHCQKPKVWKKIKSNWSKEFQNIDIDVECDVNIKSSGLYSNPLKIGD